MNEQEQYALAIAEGTFNGSFEEFIAANGNAGGNDGSGDATQDTVAYLPPTDAAAAAKARAEMDNDAKAKKAAESTKGGTPTGGLLSLGKKNIEPLSKSAQLAQWNAKYAKFSADDLQKEQNRLSQLGDTGGELLNFVNGVLNKIQTEQAAAQEAKFKALDAKRKAAAAQALLETQDNAELRRKRLADEAKSAEENAKIIAAELLIKKA
jgi:hypothetical protein